jgi:hypothetical protein
LPYCIVGVLYLVLQQWLVRGKNASAHESRPAGFFIFDNFS